MSPHFRSNNGPKRYANEHIPTTQYFMLGISLGLGRFFFHPDPWRKERSRIYRGARQSACTCASGKTTGAYRTSTKQHNVTCKKTAPKDPSKPNSSSATLLTESHPGILKNDPQSRIPVNCDPFPIVWRIMRVPRNSAVLVVSGMASTEGQFHVEQNDLYLPCSGCS